MVQWMLPDVYLVGHINAEQVVKIKHDLSGSAIEAARTPISKIQIELHQKYQSRQRSTMDFGLEHVKWNPRKLIEI